MTFEEYLVKKRINKAAFEAADAARFTAWEQMYAQMHPNSFYMAVKMVLNDVRLRFHLKEEDVPKVAPVIAIPKPVVRRAPAVTETAPTPALEDNAETKPATFKPRPMVKRTASLQKPTPSENEVNTGENLSGNIAEGTTAVESEKPAAKPRPVIKRPVISRPVADQAASLEDVTPSALGEATTGTEEKPVRPRPVIKRPAALQKPGAAETDKPGTTAQETINLGTEEKPSPAPTRPRPVIKRLAALQKPAEETPAESIKPAEEEAGPEVTPETGVTAQEEQKPKPPRPRPVIKRPAPVADPAVSEAKTVESIQPVKEKADEPETPKQSEPTGEDIKPKPPRPRPIIKRPSPKTDETNGEMGD